MKKFYVIGSQTSKSLSPTIFNYWFKKYKINAEYFYIEVAKQKKEHIQSLEIPGIVISKRTFKRNYPQGEIFSQLIGLTNYKNEGVNGIEFALEETLKAKDGYQEKILSRKSGVIQNKIIKPTVPTNVKVVDFTDKPKSKEKIKVKYF